MSASLPAQVPDKPPRARCWIPLSLRIFAAVLLLLAVGPATVALLIWLPYYRDQQAIQKIEELQGWVSVESIAPDWLRHLMGDDRIAEFKGFERIVFVDLRGTHVTDADLSHLGKMVVPKSLNLDGTAVSDAGITHLRGLTSLAHLSVRLTSVTPDGVEKLQRSLPDCSISR
jgi:hypothetical protein